MEVKCPKCHTENPSDSKYCKECATHLPSSKEIPVTETLETPTEELTRGTTFAGRYEIIEELGKGGMGKVYRVEDKKIKEEVALKLIKPEIASDKITIERFSNELKIARKIAHRNVGRMYHLSDHEGTHYITMEYVPGEDLKSFIRRSGQLAIGTTIKIAKQVSEGLAEAHRLGVIHRDLKPSNIMIDREGNARIMDFGIARSLKQKGLTGAGVMVGTPEYMSPEQTEAKEVDRQSDVYSLGVILYEMVTGRLPFEGDTPLSIAMKHKGEMPKDPRELNLQIPEDLSLLILKCLEKKKEDRYPGAEYVFSELSKIEQRIPTTERIKPKRKPITSKEITVTFGLKKLFIPALVFIAVVIIGLILLKVLPKKEAVPVPSDRPSIAVMYFENRSDEPDLDKILVDMLTTNLSRYEGIEVVSSQRLFDILKQLGKQNVKIIDKNMATEIANRAGVKNMMMGSVIKIGNKIRITSHLTNVQDGTIIASEQVEGNKINEVFEMVDELTKKLSIKLGISEEGEEQLFNIADVTTNSLEAYRYYQKGSENLKRLNYLEAEKNFQKAVDIDPQFAMAYVNLAYAKMGDITEIDVMNPFIDLTTHKKILNLAKKYFHKVTKRERLIINIYESFFNRDFEQAENLTLQLVKEYPDDRSGNLLLTFFYWVSGNYKGMRDVSEKYLEIDPANEAFYNNLSYAYAYLNDYSAAVSASKKCIALEPEIWVSYDTAWEISVLAGKFDEALSFLEQGLNVNQSWDQFHQLMGYTYLIKREVNRARLEFRLYSLQSPKRAFATKIDLSLSYLFEGKYKEAQAEFRKAVELAQSEKDIKREINARLYLGKIFSIQRKHKEAIKEFERTEEISWKIYDKSFNPIPILSNYYIGIVRVKGGDYKAAQSHAQKITQLIKDQNLDDLYLDYYYLLLGELKIAQIKWSDARNIINESSLGTKSHSPEYRKLSAAAYALHGDFEKAIETYQTFNIHIDLMRYGRGDEFYFFRECSLVDYHVAKIYEKMAYRTKATEHYEKFLDLWKDADPGISEVEDAKKRVAGLK